MTFLEHKGKLLTEQVTESIARSIIEFVETHMNVKSFIDSENKKLKEEYEKLKEWMNEKELETFLSVESNKEPETIKYWTIEEKYNTCMKLIEHNNCFLIHDIDIKWHLKIKLFKLIESEEKDITVRTDVGIK